MTSAADFKCYREGFAATSLAMNPYAPGPRAHDEPWDPRRRRASRVWTAGYWAARRLEREQGAE